MYDIRETHYRDIYGRLLWVAPVTEDYRLHDIGEAFIEGEFAYKVERVALAENIEHVNISKIEEDLNIVEPYL